MRKLIAIMALPLALALPIFGGVGGSHAQEQQMDDMQHKIESFAKAGPEGARLPLSEITDFEWDQVWGFNAALPIEVFRHRLGDDYTMSEESQRKLSDDSGILVFTLNGEVVGEITTTPPVHFSGLKGDSFGADAGLTVATPDPGPYSLLRLEE